MEVYVKIGTMPFTRCKTKDVKSINVNDIIIVQKMRNEKDTKIDNSQKYKIRPVHYFGESV